jgi:hypothetical protein
MMHHPTIWTLVNFVLVCANIASAIIARRYARRQRAARAADHGLVWIDTDLLKRSDLLRGNVPLEVFVRELLRRAVKAEEIAARFLKTPPFKARTLIGEDLLAGVHGRKVEPVLTAAERDAVAHVRTYGDKHSWTSCPPGTRSMCPHRAAYTSAAEKFAAIGDPL